jgi:large repetitive protein
MLTDSLTAASVLTSTVTVMAIPQDTIVANNTQPWFMRVGEAPNLMNGTRKTATPIDIAHGRVATYTVSVVNSGNITAAATITDPIPAGVTYQSGSSTLDGLPIELYNSALNQIEWTGLIEAAHAIEVQFNVNAIAVGGQVTNTVQLDDGAGLIITRSAAVAWPWPVYLPLVQHD